MGESNDLESKLVKRVAKSLLWIIVFFIVYVCGFATLVMHFDNDFKHDVFKLVCIIAFFPLIVFFAFWDLISRQYKAEKPEKISAEENIDKP